MSTTQWKPGDAVWWTVGHPDDVRPAILTAPHPDGWHVRLVTPRGETGLAYPSELSKRFTSALERAVYEAVTGAVCPQPYDGTYNESLNYGAPT
jgi:hypothetical protein